MIGKEVISSEPITNSEVKEVLIAKQEGSRELVENLEAKLVKLEAEIKEPREQLRELKRELDDLEEKNASIQEIDQTRDKIVSMNKELRPAMKAINHVKDQIEKYELSYDQNLTLDHTRKFGRLPVKEAQELVEKLDEIVRPKKSAVKIVNIMPQDLSDLRLLFAKERVPVSNEDMIKILEIVDEYRYAIPVVEEEEEEEVLEEETETETEAEENTEEKEIISAADEFDAEDDEEVSEEETKTETEEIISAADEFDAEDDEEQSEEDE